MFLDWLNALNDPARLRILHLIEREELGVGEIARIVQMPQSTISRHLKQLLDSGFAAKRAAGTSSMYRLWPDHIDPDAARLWSIARAQTADSPAFIEDLARLEEVIRERHIDTREFFGRLGGEWDALRRELFGEPFTAEALLSLVNPHWTVADLGCGTGNATELLAPWVKKVIALDREPSMIEAAQKHLRDCINIEFRQGDLLNLPLSDGEVDAAIVFLVMHHVEQPADAVREVARCLRPGGVALVVDMVSHDRETYRHTMGHVHLGFCEQDVSAWARSAGLRDARYRRLRPQTDARGPMLFAATMHKP